jgi:hypothetical protein
MSLTTQTINFPSSLIFKVIPFFNGLFLLYFVFIA